MAFKALFINGMCFLRPTQLSENLCTASRPFRPKIRPTHEHRRPQCRGLAIPALLRQPCLVKRQQVETQHHPEECRPRVSRPQPRVQNKTHLRQHRQNRMMASAAWSPWIITLCRPSCPPSRENTVESKSNENPSFEASNNFSIQRHSGRQKASICACVKR